MEYEDRVAIQAVEKLAASDKLTIQMMVPPMEENEYDRVQNGKLSKLSCLTFLIYYLDLTNTFSVDY